MELKWKLLDFSRMPKTDNVYILMMAAQWKLKNNQPFGSAVDKARERKGQQHTTISAGGQKVRAKSR